MTRENEAKNHRALQALQDLLEKLAKDDTGILHVFKMYLAENEERYYSFAKKMQTAWMKTAIGLVLALAVGSYLIGRAHSAGQEARTATRELRATVVDNRILIRKLEKVAEEAQKNGGEASRILCRKFEDFKIPVREVLTKTGSTRFLHLFKRESCKDLPNATPVTP